MRRCASLTRSFLMATAIVVAAGLGGAKASFLSTSPNPFPPGGGFVQSPGCLTSGPLAGVCASAVTGAILSSSSMISGGNQYFTLDENVAGEVSFAGAPIGNFSVEGDLELKLDNRTSSSETGTFNGEVLSEDYVGTFDGLPVEFTLDSTPSTLQVTITAVRDNLFRIDSSFDLNSQISINGGAPIPFGGLPVTGVGAVPEPRTWVLLGLPMLVLGLVRSRRDGLRRLRSA